MTLFIIINQNPLFAKANPFQICQLIVESRLEFKMDEIFAKVRVLMKMSFHLKSEREESNSNMSICCKLCQTRKLKKIGKYLKRSDSLEKLLGKIIILALQTLQKNCFFRGSCLIVIRVNIFGITSTHFFFYSNIL